MKHVFGALVVAAVALVADGPASADHLSRPPDPTRPIEDPIPGHVQQYRDHKQMQVIAFGHGLTAPLYATYAPGPLGQPSTQQNIIYVVDQDGPLWAMDRNTGAKSLFLNVRVQKPTFMPLGAFGPGTFDERGFLGVAFHPDYQVPGAPGFGKLYTYTSELPGTNADVPPDHFNVVTEWQVANPLTPPPVFPAPEDDDDDNQPPPEEATPTGGAVPVRELLRIAWPQFNHNGGAIFFGTRADDRRFLYVTTGDGGCADDQNLQIGFRLVPCQGHGAGSEATAPNRFGNGQGTGDPQLAKVLRLDPIFAPVPAPLAFGLRNPWRASSDRADLGGSGDIWLSDVGQNHLEEIDHLKQLDIARVTQGQLAGVNFGWHFKEGTFLFNPFLYELLNPASDGFVYANSPGNPPDMTDPVAQYDHDEGTASIGGFVYRGRNAGLADIRGRYVFGDYSRRFLNGNGEVFVLLEEQNCNPHDCTPRVFYLVNGTLPGNTFMLGFGEDVRGELYGLANETGIPFEETGMVMKLVRRCADDGFVNGRRDNSGNTCRD